MFTNLGGMETRTITSIEHTTSEGKLNLTVDLGIPNEDVSVVVQVRHIIRGEVDKNGWPFGYFEQVPGSMPNLTRMHQGEFEKRAPLE